MKNSHLIKISVFLLTLLFSLPGFGTSYHYTVAAKDIHNSVISKKIWLSSYAMPGITVSGIVFTPGVQLPANAKVADPHQVKCVLGMERKKPFVVVHIPAYAKGADVNTINLLSEVNVNIEEHNNTVANRSTARTTDVATSVLANGTWYKIGVTQTGFYKIDYSFINSMGVDPSTVNPANIRIVGNGGHMLSEDNSVSRPVDLIENAIWVNAGTDATFKNGDYAVFYGVGTTNWVKDSLNKRFVHQNNLYADTACYFISFNSGTGLRITGQTPVGTANVTSTTYNYYDRHEADLVNPTGYSKWWYGEEFNPLAGNLSQTFNFNSGNAVLGNIYATVAMASTCDQGVNYFSFSINGMSSPVSSPAAPTTGDEIMDTNMVSASIPCNTNNINVTVTFQPADNNTSTTLGYLYYIELNGRCNLNMYTDQLNFRDWQTVGTGNIATYNLQGANGFTQVWDVTNPQLPVQMAGSLSGSTYSFKQDAAMLHEFAAMNSANLFTPIYIKQVAPQNIHGAPQSELLIVTYPGFLDAAQKLASFHLSHDNISAYIATTEQIYNEFSSGIQDISAIRDFAKMFYDRGDSVTMPKYMILFGGASYDYKNRIINNSNLAPVFESAEFSYDLDSYSSDDFFGFLDSTEYIENYGISNALDISVGRLPARSVADADSLVDKIINYASPQALGPWRIYDIFAACRDDGAGEHMEVAEQMAQFIDSASHNLYNLTKVYEDAIPVITTPAGDRCPNANAAIDQQIYNGAFMFNYNGHGNTQVLSAERILTSTDYNSWTNRNMLPFMITATCDFGQFDHPDAVSAAEQILLLHGTGSIAMLTTTQAVFSQFNQTLNGDYVTSQYTALSKGSYNTFGTSYISGKNEFFASSSGIDNPDETINFRKFTLMGDPALTPDFPKYSVVIDSMIDGATMLVSDTMSALGKYIINGSVRDFNNNVIPDFNGTIWLSVYDKPTTVIPITSSGYPYQVQNSIIYKGIATVTNGMFSVAFITPKDINYSYGFGKISTYTDNNITDAAGADMNHTVGGFSKNPVLNNTPPVVKAYINDSLFINGGITGNNTSLYLLLEDSTGINVSGNVIGHDLVAILDGNFETPYVLNNYYQTFPNTYQKGYVNFPVYGLADGKHNFKITAWDVNDNYGEGSVEFTVVDGQVVDIKELMNYPNPFSNTTNFVFEHNHPLEQADVQINIYNTQGTIVKNINESIMLPDSRTAEITWDGTGNNGVRLPSGVYVYQLKLTTETGIQSVAYQKLVIVR